MLVKRYLTDGYCLLVCGSLRTCSIRASFGLGFGFAETKTTKLSPKLFFISLGSGMMEPSGCQQFTARKTDDTCCWRCLVAD